MALLNVSDAVDEMASGTYTVRRREPPTFIKGRKVEGLESTFQAAMTITPISGRELERLAEGTRLEDVLEVFSTTELRTDSVNGMADLIEYGGYDFEVEEVADWNALGGFWRYRARRQGPSPQIEEGTGGGGSPPWNPPPPQM